MWTHEHTAETDLAPEVIWRVLSGIDDWTSWDTSMEQITIHGPFIVGTEISMIPKGQEPIRSTIVEIEPNQRYADETTINDLTLRFSHTLTRLEAGGTRRVHMSVISGPSTDDVGPEIGTQITEDFPAAMNALIARANAVSAERS